MPTDAQRDVVAFLSTPEAYGVPAGLVERIDTHISTVWLAGERAFKLKRAVRYDYVDFCTVERRRIACEAEVRLNRRTAPTLYRGVRAMTRESDGSLALGGRGVALDWVVEMARFDQDTLFDRLAERGRLDVALMPGLAAAIVRRPLRQWSAAGSALNDRIATVPSRDSTWTATSTPSSVRSIRSRVGE